MASFPTSRQQQRLFDLIQFKGMEQSMLLSIKAKFDEQQIRAFLTRFIQQEENLQVVLKEDALSKYPLQEVLDDAPLNLRINQCATADEALALIKAASGIGQLNGLNTGIRFVIFVTELYWI